MPGTAVGISALMAGDVEFLNAGGNIVIGANLKGADLVMLGGLYQQRHTKRHGAQRNQDPLRPQR
jgi:hypothetical protein